MNRYGEKKAELAGRSDRWGPLIWRFQNFKIRLNSLFRNKHKSEKLNHFNEIFQSIFQIWPQNLTPKVGDEKWPHNEFLEICYFRYGNYLSQFDIDLNNWKKLLNYFLTENKVQPKIVVRKFYNLTSTHCTHADIFFCRLLFWRMPNRAAARITTKKTPFFFKSMSRCALAPWSRC